MKTALRLLTLRRLRRQPLRTVIAIVTVAAGVSLAIALSVVTSSVRTSVRDFGRTLSGPAPLRVIGATSRGGITPDVVGAVERTPGVESAVPVVVAVTLAQGSSGPTERDTDDATRERDVPVAVLGVDCRVEAQLGSFGCTPDLLAAAGDRPLLMGTGLARQLGTDALVRTNLGRQPLTGTPPRAELDQLSKGRVVVFALGAAQRLFGRGSGVDVVYVRPQAGVDLSELETRLEEAAGPQNGVLRAGEPPPETELVLMAFIPLFALLGLAALATGAVLIYNTVTLSLEDRRRELAIIGALGAPAGVTAGGALLEAGVVGLVGGLVGVGGGALVAGPITGSLSNFTERVVGITLDVHVRLAVVALGAGLGLVVALGAAVIPARRALRLDVAAELSNRERREEAAPLMRWRRAVVSLLVAAIGAAGCWVAQRDGGLEQWQATVAPIAFTVLATGLLLSTAAVAPMVLTTLDRAKPAALRLAVVNLRREPRRAGVMGTAIAAALIVGFITASYSRAVRDHITEGVTRNPSGVAVGTVAPNNSGNIEAKLSPRTLKALQRLPESAGIERWVGLVTGRGTGDLIGVSAVENPSLDADLIVGTADRARFEAGEVLIGPGLARRDDLRPGDLVEIPTPTGIAVLLVQAVTQEGDFAGNNVELPFALFERLYGPQPPAGVAAVPAPGVSLEALAAAIRDADLDPDLLVWTSGEFADELSDSIEGQLAPFWVLQRGLLFVAFVAVLSTLLLIGVQRRRELGLLAAVGMRPAELARMVLAEAGLAAGVGIVLGAIVGFVALWGLLTVTPILVGFREPYRPDLLALLTGGLISIAIALVAGAWPARRTAKVEVLEALHYE